MKTKTKKLIIYHNPSCSKSREACSLVKTKGLEFATVKYLEDPLGEEEIRDLLKKLGLKAEELVRKKEALYKEKYAEKVLSEKQWVSVLARHPVLIERPVIVYGNKAVIGRPTKNIEKLF
jgi:arsenate reductase